MSNPLMKTWLSADRLFYRFGALLVAAFALGYYVQYYRSGLNFGGEAGTDAVIAMRLLAGGRPIADTFLGYNVMWFYPIAWLFRITGPDYVAMRVYFFVICAVTGLMAFFVIRRATGSGIWATIGACLPVLVPGMISRNYMAFLAVLNMTAFLHAWVFAQPDRRRQALWICASGFSLALTWLMRIDLGMFFTVILAGLIVLYPVGPGRLPGVKTACAGAVLAVMFFIGLHAPFYFDAVRRNYSEEFVSQYRQWAPFVTYLAKMQWHARETAPTASVAPQIQPSPVKASPPLPPSVPTVRSTPSVAVVTGIPPVRKDIDAGNYQTRPPLSALLDRAHWKLRFFATALYLPALVAFLAVLSALLALVVAIFREDARLRESALVVLGATGAALTLFSQYFFFRPDISHLADFMAVFMPAMFCAGWIAIRECWSRGRTMRGFGLVFAALCIWDTGVYLAAALPQEGSGSIAAARGRNVEFAGANGVRVLLSQDERDQTQALYREITGASKPGEFVVCYPYGATISLLTGHPSYEYNLYVDNASNVMSFRQEAIPRFLEKNPAAIVIDNININGTEESRFKNWAAPVYDYIRSHYDYRGTYRRQEVYVRRTTPQNKQP